jgi:hypothetical protein
LTTCFCTFGVAILVRPAAGFARGDRWPGGGAERRAESWAGIQDKRLGPRFEPSGCLHIVFYGAKGVWDGAVASFGRLKRLILLGAGGWQSWAGIVPDRFEEIEAARVLPVPDSGARRGACAVKPRDPSCAPVLFLGREK